MLRHTQKQLSSSPYRPGHGGYVSEFTRFMDGFLAQHPDVARDQMNGMEILWDHEPDFAEQKKAARDSVPVKGYEYF